LGLSLGILGGLSFFGLSDSASGLWRDLAGRGDSLVEAGKIDLHHLLRHSGGERRALESEDADYVDRVARAMDKHLSLAVDL